MLARVRVGGRRGHGAWAVPVSSLRNLAPLSQVCHSKSGEVNSTKVANLVKAYVDKYKYSRKGSQKQTLEEAVSAEKHVG